MGEAKRRGSYEDRKNRAVLRNAGRRAAVEVIKKQVRARNVPPVVLMASALMAQERKNRRG